MPNERLKHLVYVFFLLKFYINPQQKNRIRHKSAGCIVLKFYIRTLPHLPAIVLRQGNKNTKLSLSLQGSRSFRSSSRILQT